MSTAVAEKYSHRTSTTLYRCEECPTLTTQRNTDGYSYCPQHTNH